MSEMDTPAQDEPEMESGRGSSRIVLMLVALAIVLAAGGWWAYSKYEANQAAERAQEARAAAKRKADQEAKRAAEDAKMAADLQAQKVAADEALRRAQEDRDRVARELEQVQGSRAAARKRAK